MTLLESVVAFVVLALVGLACLDLSRGALELQRSSSEWTRAVSRGESALAAAEVGAPADATESAGGDQAKRGRTDAPVRVTRQQWRDGVELIEVTVPLQNGADFTLTRLVPTKRAAGQVAAARP